jgi:hypothetical protein
VHAVELIDAVKVATDELRRHVIGADEPLDGDA